MIQAQYLITHLSDLERFAAMLIRAIDIPATLALTGNLGSGKTAFVQQLGKQLGVNEPIVSPTFTLINQYNFVVKVNQTKAASSAGTLIHADLYRLQDTSEIELLGLQDYFTQPNTITAIEWADRKESLMPKSVLWINFEIADLHRVATLVTDNKVFWHRLEKLRDQ